MKLLAADLRVLRNLPTTNLGRRTLLSAAIGIGLLAMLTWWFAQAVVTNPQLLARLHRETGGDELRGLLGYGLMACPLVATWLGLALAQRQLFEGQELALWRQAPIASARPAMQVLVRATFLSCCWAAALALPFLSAMLQSRQAPAWAHGLALLTIVGATAPMLATLLAVHIVLVRFFAGRWLRLVFALIGALASVGFSTWLLMTMFARGHERVQDVVAIASLPRQLPWTIDTGAALLAAAARGTIDIQALAGLASWLVITVLVFRVVADLHPRAYERYLTAEPPLWRNHRRWSTSVASTLRKKEFAQVLQQPGALIGFLVFGVLVFALAKEQVMVGGILKVTRVPRDVTHLAVLLTQWFLAVLLVLYAHMGRLVLADSAQWALYACSPASAFAILRGKLTAIFAFMLWPLLLVALTGVWLLDANVTTLAVFVGVALGGTAVAMGVLAVVGTSPALMRPEDSGHTAQGGKNFLGALVLVIAFQLAIVPVSLAIWDQLANEQNHRLLSHGLALQWAPIVVGIALAYGGLMLLLGMWLGSRNLRRLLRAK